MFSIRIYPKQFDTDEQFERLVAFLKQYHAAMDEICLFTNDNMYSYTPLKELKCRSKLLAHRILQLRQMGFNCVGINEIATIGGHVDHGWDFLPPLPFQPLVGYNGLVSKSCACPFSIEFHTYIREKYRLSAEARPDFIWVDDDLRMEHDAMGCFCSFCLKDFTSERYDRETLVARFNAPDGRELRKAWVERNTRVLEDLLRDITSAVHKVDPGIDVGLMVANPGSSTYSGEDLDRWLRALGGRRARPGCSAYIDDYIPRSIVNTAIDVGRIVQALPPSVDNIQYELENFPYQKLGKSIQTALNECTLALSLGCNGIAINALDFSGPYEDYHDMFGAITRERKAWDVMIAAQKGLPVVGLWSAFDYYLMGKREVENGDWFARVPDYDVHQPNALAQIGLPLTSYPKSACATLLSGRIVEAFSDEELRHILSGGVLLDASTLEVLWKRGLGELTGVKPGKICDNCAGEWFTSHELNGPYTGEGRSDRALHHGFAQELIPLDDTVGDICHIRGIDSSVRGSCLATYTNALGGRVVIMAYNPWVNLGSSAKRSQLIALADWASRGALPLLIDRTVRVTPFIRLSADRRRFVATLLSTSFDATGPLEVRLRANPARIALLTPEGLQDLPLQMRENEVVVTLPDILPWRTAILIGL